MVWPSSRVSLATAADKKRKKKKKRRHNEEQESRCDSNMVDMPGLDTMGGIEQAEVSAQVGIV